MQNRTVTQRFETDVEPQALFELLENPHRLPSWALDFADEITGDEQQGWRVTKNGKSFSVRAASPAAKRCLVNTDEKSPSSRACVAGRLLRSCPSSHVVDYLRETAPGREGGAYLRILPRPVGGSVIVMTVPIPPGVEADKVLAGLSGELQRLIPLAV